MPAIKARDVTFLGLRDSVLCSDCELISYNNTHKCLACGSTAVLSLSRVLGGSLLGEQRVRVVAAEAKQPVLDADRRRGPAPAFVPVPIPALASTGYSAPARMPIYAALDAGRAWLGVALSTAEAIAATPVHSAMKVVAERGFRLSRSGGAAIAANRSGRMVCEARMGASAPALGAEVRSGLSALTVHSGRTMRCDFAPDDVRVDADSCRALGVNSIVAAPICNLDRVLGLVTVLSPQPYAFDDHDVAIVQWLASVMAVVFTSGQTDASFFTRSTTRAELPGTA